MERRRGSGHVVVVPVRDHVLMATIYMSSAVSSSLAEAVTPAPDYTTSFYKLISTAYYLGPDGTESLSANGATSAVGSTVPAMGSSGGAGTQYYRMRGWYAAGTTFEIWVGTSPYTPPPSGHTLADVSFIPFDVGL